MEALTVQALMSVHPPCSVSRTALGYCGESWGCVRRAPATSLFTGESEHWGRMWNA